MYILGFFWSDGGAPEGREGRRARRIFSHCCLSVKGGEERRIPRSASVCDQGAPAYLKVGSIGCEEFGSGDDPLPQAHSFFLFSVVSVFQTADFKTSDGQQFAVMFVSKCVLTPPPKFSLLVNHGKYSKLMLLQNFKQYLVVNC